MNQDRRPSRRLLAARPLLVLAFDGAASAFAAWLALQLRFDGAAPEFWRELLERALPVLLCVRLGVNAAAGIHRWHFFSAGAEDAVRVVAATTIGSVAFVVAAEQLFPPGLPRTVYALEFFLSTAAYGASRFGPQLLARWLRRRLRRAGGAPRATIVGTGPGAELLARDLLRNGEAPYDLVGLVGDDPLRVGLRIEGRPILGVMDDLPALVRRHRISVVLLAERPSAERVREILQLCEPTQVRFKIVPPSFGWGGRRATAAMLNDVAPEDLLPRPAIAFDPEEIRSLVRGRRALVTGAGGSIGSEICRQLARNGVAELVIVDLNENELYLGARRLAQEFPELAVHPEVADVRDLPRMLRLGAKYRPQDVLHAAAHKHVPLLENVPSEAVKNNVFGTLHVARMAVAAGAERFVLISTDKAVKPSSVMGASKRVAELVVRAVAQGSRTQMTCVRFGNVLGSAGSVVPLFKEQIARGGPVTVTHPECTRYFMTISEAVGLVLLAGLRGYGELCVLDMGEPIRIEALARHMITLAGHIPGVDIPIHCTGLRPGEKLHEEVLTEEEERTHVVRDGIRVAHSPSAPGDLVARLERLRRHADDGDEEEVLAEVEALVPSFSGRAPARAPGTPVPRPGTPAPRWDGQGAGALPILRLDERDSA